MKFFPSDTGSPILDLGSNYFYADTGAKFVLDLSNYHYIGTGFQTFTLIKFGSTLGQPVSTYVNSGTVVAGANYTINYTINSTSVQVTISHSSVYSTYLEKTGVADSNAGVQYEYAPSLMYDESEGLYKVWDTISLPSGPGTATYDNIGYKEYPTLEGLNAAPTTFSLSPTGVQGQPYGGSVADPSVYRDSNTGTYYLAFTGNSNKTSGQAIDQIFMANSADGGRNFTPYSINGPDGELVNYDAGSQVGDIGVAQPSVVQISSSVWLMSLTDASYTHSNPAAPVREILLESTIADFRSGVVYLTSYNVGQYNLSSGVTITYNPVSSKVVLVSDSNTLAEQTNGQYYNYITLTSLAFDQNPSTPAANRISSPSYQTVSILGSPDAPYHSAGFSFSEQLGVLTTSSGSLYLPGDNYYTFMGATYLHDNSKPSFEWPVDGPLDYISALSS